MTQTGLSFGTYSENRFAPALGRSVRRQVMLVPGQGCVPWLRTKGECCTFCRLPAGTRLAVMGPGHEDHFDGWDVSVPDYREMIDTCFAQSDRADAIAVFNGGSFLTDREIPKEAREHVYRSFADHPTATDLMVESRPEFVQPDLIDEAQALIGDKTLTVAIGLESMDDRIRNQVLKKFIGRRSFTAALERLQVRGLRSFVYVFLGAPGLSERESYEDALRSVRQLADMGVDEIALSCAFVPPGGQLERQYKAGTFRPPWLWTIAQLLEVAQDEGLPVSLGGFDDFPPPVAIPSNCPSCDEQMHTVLQGYRETGRISPNTYPSCTCRGRWPLGRRTKVAERALTSA